MTQVPIPDSVRAEFVRAAAWDVLASCDEINNRTSYDNDDDVTAFRERRAVLLDRIATLDSLEAGAQTIDEKIYRRLLPEAASKVAYELSNATDGGASPDCIVELAELNRELQRLEDEVAAHA